MFRTFKPVKLVAAVATIVAVMLAAATPSQAQTGAVRLNMVKVGFIVGAGGGSGTLSYHGRTYRLSVGGVSLGSLGVAGALIS